MSIARMPVATNLVPGWEKEIDYSILEPDSYLVSKVLASKEVIVNAWLC